MPDQDRKVKATEKSTDKKQQGITTRDYSDLKRLRCLLNVQSRKQQLPAINFDSTQNSMTKSEPAIKVGEHRTRGQWHESTEAVELENFSINYKNERNFSKHPQHKLFEEIFTALVKNRLICSAPSFSYVLWLKMLNFIMLSKMMVVNWWNLTFEALADLDLLTVEEETIIKEDEPSGASKEYVLDNKD